MIGNPTRLHLPFLLIGHALLGIAFAWVVPPWEAPDEPAHYRRVRELACRAVGDPDGSETDAGSCTGGVVLGDAGEVRLTGSGFCPAPPPRSEPSIWSRRSLLRSYQSYQPPFGHLAYVPAYLLFGPRHPVLFPSGSHDGGAGAGVFLHEMDHDPLIAPSIRRLRWLRLLGVAFGMATVAATWIAARSLAPSRPDVALAAGAAVAFLPQFDFVAGTLNNDTVSAAAGGALIAWVVRGLCASTAPRGFWLPTVALLILALGSRPNALGLIGVALPALWIVGARRVGRRRALAAALASLVALGAAGVTFRALSPSAWATAAGQALSRLRPGSWLDGPPVLGSLLRSAVGVFGWLEVPLPAVVYAVAAVLAAAAALGLMSLLLRPTDPAAPRGGWLDPRRRTVLLVLAAGASLLALTAWLNATATGQAQGRYLFPGLAGFGVLIGTGLCGGLPARGGRMVALGLALGLALVDATALTRTIPAAYGGDASGSLRPIDTSRGRLILQGGATPNGKGMGPDRDGGWWLHAPARIDDLRLGASLWIPAGDNLLAAAAAERSFDGDGPPAGIARVASEGPGTSVGDRVRPLAMEIGGVRRRALFAHPTTTLDLPPLLLEPGTRAEVIFGIDPRAWTPVSDGVTFRMSAVRAGEAIPMFERHLAPGGRPADRIWAKETAAVPALAGRGTVLRLTTLPGPRGDATSDWAAWAVLRLDHPATTPLQACTGGQPSAVWTGSLPAGGALRFGLVDPSSGSGAGLVLAPLEAVRGANPSQGPDGSMLPFR